MKARHWTLLSQADRIGKFYSQHLRTIVLNPGFIVLLAVFTFGVKASGGDRIVPDDYPTIQSAISAAGPGDSVVVKPGTYYENINFLGKAITVTSTDPSDWTVVESTVIDAGGTGSTVTFNSEEGTDSVLQGFVITGGYGTFEPLISNEVAFGGGIYCIFSSPTVRRNIITGNHGPNTNTLLSQGVGIGAVLTEMVITENIITDNDGYAGAGVLVALGQATISNNLINDNYAPIGGGVVLIDGPRLINNTIVNNEGLFAAGNIYASGEFEISNNIVTHGSSDFTGGVLIEQPRGHKLAYNNVWANQNGNYFGPSGGRAGVNGNLSEDPLFKDLDSGDYRLQVDSPCINAGDPEYQTQPDEPDLDGNERVIAGRVDMGAYELSRYDSAVWMIGKNLREIASLSSIIAQSVVEGYEDCNSLEQYLAFGDYDDLESRDILQSKQDLHTAIQHEQQTLQKLHKCTEKLNNALVALRWVSTEALLDTINDSSSLNSTSGDSEEAVCDSVYETISVIEDVPARIDGLLALGLQVRLILTEAFENGELDHLKKGDLIKCKQAVHSAMQHEDQAIDALEKSVERLESCFETLECEAPEEPNEPGWQLLWSDEFDTPGKTSPDPASWEHMIGNGCEYGICGWGNNELQWYTDDISNSWVENGHLTIQAKEESPGSYTSARLRTKYRRDFLYGRIEARIKVPHGGGMWPAFWMMPTDDVYGTWAASGEIDIMETRNETNYIGGALHFGGQWPDNTFISGDYYGDGNTDFSQDFHVYALEWEADQMRWYVDGVEYFSATSDQWYSLDDLANERAPFDQQFHILLNIAVGGYYTGCTQPGCITANFPQQMRVDYVRVYQWQE